MGADMEKVNKNNGRTPLMEAVEANHVRVVRLLLSAGANVEARDLRQSTSLCVAANKGFNEIAGILLTHGADVNTFNQHRCTPLHEAYTHKRIDVSLTLIKAGADFRIPNEGQSSAWDLCAQKGHLTLLHAILATHPDMDINLTGRNEWSALEKASEQNHRDVVDFLLERGANPNIRFPLYHAALHGHTTVVKALIKHGADPERSYNDESPLYRACRSGRLETVMAILNTQKVNVNSLTKDNWTPLHQACWRGSTEIAKQLLRYGANPSTGDKHGYLPLHRAAQQGNSGVVKVLLELEFVDVNCTHKDKWTPLHEASCHGHMDVVEELLNHGARTDLQNNTGKTPLPLAATANHKNIVRLLMS